MKNKKRKNKSAYHAVQQWLRREKEETAVLLRCIPATVVSLFVVSVICMNLLANKTLVQTYWIALDGGILISWLSFMCMDIITKYFGPKASNKIAIMASAINVLTCLIFYIASIIPSQANEPMGFERPLRDISTPVIVVVVTAPRPTHITPNLPFVGFTLHSFIVLFF